MLNGASGSSIRRTGSSRLGGELIAVEHDSVFVLTSEGLLGLPQSGVERARITYYDADAGGALAWSTLGGLSTLSHGYYLVLTLPTWILTGTLCGTAVADAARISYPDAGWTELRNYARFPRGFPPGLDRATLKKKE